jgi:transposase
MTVLARHLATRDQDYAFTRSALVIHKRRNSSSPAAPRRAAATHRQPGAAYNDKQHHDQDNAAAERAEGAYQAFVTHWQPGNEPDPEFRLTISSVQSIEFDVTDAAEARTMLIMA